MAYSPENNPYIPGDPYSYDLKWMVSEIKRALSMYDGLESDFESLKDYVNNYFANLDLTTEVRLIINEMVSDGTLIALVKSELGYMATITQYQHLENNGDWTLALQTALTDNGAVKIDRDINLNSMITLLTGQAIILDNVTITKPATADNVDPIFFLNGTFASVRGIGAVSLIKDEKASPDGIIKIGQPDNTTATKTVINCTVSDLMVWGAENNSDNMGIHLCGTYGVAPDYFASYFHILTNLFIRDVAMGIVFNNAANANIVSNVEFWGCGYNSTTGAFCFIRTQDPYSTQHIPLENVITNAFHHYSPNGSTLYFGTALGYNRIDNIICEQGGANSHVYAVVSTDPVSSLRNVIKYTNNSNAGTITSDEFISKNTIESQSGYTSSTLKATGTFVNKGWEVRDPHKFVYVIQNDSGLYENTEYTIGQFAPGAGTSHYCNVVKLTAATKSPSLQLLNRCAQHTYTVNYNGAGDANRTATELGTGVGTLDITVESDGTLRMKLPDNGTNTHNTDVMILVEIFGYIPANQLVLSSGFSRTN